MKETVIIQLETARALAKANLQGVTHEHSLHRPHGGGNCIHWVLGHLVATYNSLLPTLGQEAYWSEEEAFHFRRGGDPLTDSESVMDLATLQLALDEAHTRFIHGLKELPNGRLAEPAPYSPGKNPDETLGSLLTLIAFHQAYHVGQLGLLRRVAGLANAIR